MSASLNVLYLDVGAVMWGRCITTLTQKRLCKRLPKRNNFSIFGRYSVARHVVPAVGKASPG